MKCAILVVCVVSVLFCHSSVADEPCDSLMATHVYYMGELAFEQAIEYQLDLAWLAALSAATEAQSAFMADMTQANYDAMVAAQAVRDAAGQALIQQTIRVSNIEGQIMMIEWEIASNGC